MRVSERQRYATAVDRIERAKSNNAGALDTLSTQKRINALHDDPIGTSRVIKQKAQIDSNESFQRNIMFTKGFLETTETALANVGDRLIRAQELAIGMANDNYAQESRSATALEISEIINEVIQLANSAYNGRYVFSGFRTDTPPLSDDGDYLGDDGGIYLPIEDSNFKQINIPGRYVFGPTDEEKKSGHFNLIAGLTMLKEGLNSNDKQAIYRSIDELGHQLNKVTTFQAVVGSTYSAVNSSQQRLESERVSQMANLSGLEDADMYQATSDFKRTETVLQSTLMASNKLLQPSLLNFMQ